jgi:hypothetical protein
LIISLSLPSPPLFLSTPHESASSSKQGAFDDERSSLGKLRLGVRHVKSPVLEVLCGPHLPPFLYIITFFIFHFSYFAVVAEVPAILAAEREKKKTTTKHKMNREQIARRVDLIGPSTGAIVSVATWCALHGAEADAIMAYVVEKMKQKETSDAQRASLIYLIHELLLTCAARGVSDSAKRSILIAVSRTLPRAVQDTLRQKANDHTAFINALQKATEWWAMLNLFPSAWLKQLHRTAQEAQEAVGHHTSVPSALLQVAALMQRYQHAKEVWLQNKHIKIEEGTATANSGGVVAVGSGPDASSSSGGGSAGASSDVVDDAAHRCLIALRKAVEGRFERNTALLAWCEAEKAELEGRAVAHSGNATGVVKTEPGATSASAAAAAAGAHAATSVKEEGGVAGGRVAGDGNEDDVLGSFFS